MDHPLSWLPGQALTQDSVILCRLFDKGVHVPRTRSSWNVTVQTYLGQEAKKKCLHVGSAASPSCGEGTAVTDCKGLSDDGHFITPKRQRPPQTAHVHLCWPSHTWAGSGSRTQGRGADVGALARLGVGALGLQAG